MTATIRFDFERLEVFQAGVDATAAIEELVTHLPDGRGYVRDQLRRAANSIPLNIAEGAGEFASTEKARFYRMAKRSATECAGQILVCRRLGLTQPELAEPALSLLERVIAMLIALVKRCSDRIEPKASR